VYRLTAHGADVGHLQHFALQENNNLFTIEPPWSRPKTCRLCR